jgi:hypothetical protein
MKVLKWSVIPMVLFGMQSQAYPLLSAAAKSANGKVILYPDHLDRSKFWYFSNSIDPVANLDGSISKPIYRPNFLYFAYTGQAQARESDLKEFADAI